MSKTETLGNRDLSAYGPPFAVLRSPYMRGYRFELRPVSRGAPDNTVGIMYRRKGDGLVQSGVGALKDGVWLNGKRKPLDPDGLYWTELVKEDGD